MIEYKLQYSSSSSSSSSISSCQCQSVRVCVSAYACVSGLGLAPLFVQRCTLIQRYNGCCFTLFFVKYIYVCIYIYIYLYIFMYICVLCLCVLWGLFFLRSILYKCRRTTGSSLSIMFQIPLRSLPDARFPHHWTFPSFSRTNSSPPREWINSRTDFIPLSITMQGIFALSKMTMMALAEERMEKKKKEKGEDGRKLCPWQASGSSREAAYQSSTKI